MNIVRRTALAALVGATSLLAFSPAWADTTVKVSLWDKGDSSMDALGEGEPMGYAMSKMADMTKVTMGITADPAEIPAGTITFEATNDSKTMIHEMVLAPVKAMDTALPYNADENKVDEDAAGHIGEVAELDPAASGALTVTLDPGTYILYCNIPGHYVLGMWTLITVK